MEALAEEQPTHGDRSHVEREVCETVGALVTELGRLRAHTRVNLDDSLERGLGLGSLERVELLVRVEHAFGVRLPDAVMAEAVYPRDLVTALLSDEVAAAERIPEPVEPALPGVAAPTSARTLVEVLRWHAERNPERVNVSCARTTALSELSYGGLWQRYAATGVHL